MSLRSWILCGRLIAKMTLSLRRVISANNLRKIYVRLVQAVSQGHNMSGPRMNHAVIVDLMRYKFNLSY